jgi:hypothetical protein
MDQGFDALALEGPDLDRTPEDDADAELLKTQLAEECTFLTGVLEEDRILTVLAVAGYRDKLIHLAEACNTAVTELQTHAPAGSYGDLIRKYTPETTGLTDPSSAIYRGDESADIDVFIARRNQLKWTHSQLGEVLKTREANRELYNLRRDTWKGSESALNSALLQCKGPETASGDSASRRFVLADLEHDLDEEDSVSSPISADLPTDPVQDRQTLCADEQSTAGGSEQ